MSCCLVKPFLRWAGGKSWLINDIISLIPEKFNNYFEPFIGGGAFFFYLKSNNLIKRNAYISDINSDLVNAYIEVKNNADLIISKLKSYKNEKAFYYFIRNAISEDSIDRAVNFIYMNKTCYNGLYRVNLNGKFNVPFGNRKIVDLYDFNNLIEVQKSLINTSIILDDFDWVRKRVCQNDLIFLDPPYTIAHENNGFVKYNQKLFNWNDQERLFDLIKLIKKKKAHFILTNAKHESILNLFGKECTTVEVKRHSLIGGNEKSRKIVGEYIFTNLK